MPDTGAPWNIPYVDDSDLVRDFPTADEAQALAIAAGLTAAGNAGIGSNVVQATRTTSFSVSTTSPTDWTSVTLNFTPTSNTSKVLVIINAPEITGSGGGVRGFVTLLRGATTLFGRSATSVSDVGRPASTVLVFMDSPGTTSTLTYKARVFNAGGTTTYERGMIIAMEVKG